MYVFVCVCVFSQNVVFRGKVKDSKISWKYCSYSNVCLQTRQKAGRKEKSLYLCQLMGEGILNGNLGTELFQYYYGKRML